MCVWSVVGLDTVNASEERNEALVQASEAKGGSIDASEALDLEQGKQRPATPWTCGGAELQQGRGGADPSGRR